MPDAASPEQILLLGWNRRTPLVINQLDAYVASGSTAILVAEDDASRAELKARCADLRNLKVDFRTGDATERATLEALTKDDFDHVITLSGSDTREVQEADARTLITLLHLRDIAAKSGRTFSIVSEMLDLRNRELAAATRADDFIVSDRLVSMLLSQISESRELGAVFADLFDPEGAELYLKPAGEYVSPGQSVSFYTVVEAAKRRGEVAVGYRRGSEARDAIKGYGVYLNPRKSDSVELGEGDRVIVLANS